jgi:serine O-acetyltransferase
MNFQAYSGYVKADEFRYVGANGLGSFVKLLIWNPGFKYTFLMRTAKFLKEKGRAYFLPYAFVRILLRHSEYKYGISIPYNADVGPGLFIGHFGGIVVNYGARIGSNCNINHCVTIGAAYGGKTPGVPIIGNNVYLGPGSKIIGGISLGNDVAVGANCVVIDSIPPNGVVVGIPGRTISFKGSGEYVVNKSKSHV